jgi:hypothetical protein
MGLSLIILVPPAEGWNMRLLRHDHIFFPDPYQTVIINDDVSRGHIDYHNKVSLNKYPTIESFHEIVEYRQMSWTHKTFKPKIYNAKKGNIYFLIYIIL